jgi:hypothetical protein
MSDLFSVELLNPGWTAVFVEKTLFLDGQYQLLPFNAQGRLVTFHPSMIRVV